MLRLTYVPYADCCSGGVDVTVLPPLAATATATALQLLWNTDTNGLNELNGSFLALRVLRSATSPDEHVLGTAARAGGSWLSERLCQKVPSRLVASGDIGPPRSIRLCPCSNLFELDAAHGAVDANISLVEARRVASDHSALSHVPQSHQPCKNQSVVCRAPPRKSQTIIPSSRTQRKYSREYEAAQWPPDTRSGPAASTMSCHSLLSR